MTGIMGMCYATMSDRLSGKEKDRLVEAVGGADVARQILRDERVVRTVPRNPAVGTIVGGMLEEPDTLMEFSSVPRFVVRDNFVENRDGEVPIAYICGNSEDFLDIVEEGVPAAVMKRRRVLKRATDTNIVAILGDKDLAKIEKARSYAAHVYAFLRDCASVFECYTSFVLGASGNPLSLHIWYDDGWHIEVLPVPYPRELEIGDYAVSS